MHLNQFRRPGDFLYFPLIFSLLLTVYTCYLYTRNMKDRTLSDVFVVIASLIELLSSIILMAPNERFNSGPILFILSNCFVYLIIWFSFHLLFRKGEGPKSIKYYLLYFGYAWILISAGAGLSLTFILNDQEYFKPPYLKDNLIVVLFKLSNWIFIVTIWIALIMVYGGLSINARFKMIMFSVLITTSAAFFTIDSYSSIPLRSRESLIYLFGNVPVYFAIAIGAFSCSSWVENYSPDVELGRVTNSSYRVNIDNDSQITLTDDRIIPSRMTR